MTHLRIGDKCPCCGDFIKEWTYFDEATRKCRIVVMK